MGFGRWIVGAVLSVIALILGFSGRAEPWQIGSERKPVNVAPAKGKAAGLSSLPRAAQHAISAALAADDSRYGVRSASSGFHAENARHALVVDFTRQGVEIRSGTARWGMALRGYGYGEALVAMSATVSQATANRVEYQRGTLTEWYANGTEGLEQGFTVAKPPGKTHGKPLTLALALSGCAKINRQLICTTVPLSTHPPGGAHTLLAPQSGIRSSIACSVSSAWSGLATYYALWTP